jgi:hypothetical protein
MVNYLYRNTIYLLTTTTCKIVVSTGSCADVIQHIFLQVYIFGANVSALRCTLFVLLIHTIVYVLLFDVGRVCL